MPIRPLLLKGHERPLTCVKYNREGDLLFSVAKDKKPTVWYVDNGERLGTFNGHEGSIWDVDISYSSDKILTGSADQTARLWEVETGLEIACYKHKSGVRSVGFSHGEQMILTAQDKTFSSTPTCFIYNLSDFGGTYENKSNEQPVRALSAAGSGNFNSALWGNLNQTIITASEDGCVRIWDTETGKEVKKAQDHRKSINDMQFSKDRTMLITASSDYTARLYDAKTLTLLKTYQSNRPLNAASISPLMNHVIVGGGQEAMNVTQTDARAGHFEVDFHQTIYQDFLGSVKGHFGPVNTLAFSPDGKSYASGSEDGYIRLHHFDKDYLNAN